MLSAESFSLPSEFAGIYSKKYNKREHLKIGEANAPQILLECGESVAKVADPRPGCGQMATPGGCRLQLSSFWLLSNNI